MSIILKTNNLVSGYQHRKQKVKISQGLNLKLRPGEMICLVGPNGAGKSTLLRTLAGLQAALEGEIILKDKDLKSFTRTQLAKLVAVVLTEKISCGAMTGEEFVSLGRSPYTNGFGGLTKADKKIVSSVMDDTNLSEFKQRVISAVSDGERQKIMIARALAQEPKLLVLDEPTAFLDNTNKFEIFQLLRSLSKHQQTTILLSTHDLDLALRLADKLWLMDQKGQLLQGTPEDLVLNGKIESLFQTDRVKFDSETGSFKYHFETQTEISLIGEGPPAFWTKRALEREGFKVNQGINKNSLHLVEVKDKKSWLLKTGSENHIKIFQSIEELLEVLNQP